MMTTTSPHTHTVLDADVNAAAAAVGAYQIMCIARTHRMPAMSRGIVPLKWKLFGAAHIFTL